MPNNAWQDGFERGLSRKTLLRRNTPSLLNVNRYDRFGWEGRSPTLRKHIESVLTSKVEINTNDDAVGKVIASSHNLTTTWEKLGNGAGNLAFAARALSAFVETLATKETIFDAFETLSTSDRKKIDEGYKIFVRSGCSRCHKSPDFTDGLFHDIGLPKRRIILQADPTRPRPDRFTLGPDFGRGDVENGRANLYAFRTPSLINVALTMPYMHDGRFHSIAEVLDFYERDANSIASPTIGRLWSIADRQKLKDFLESLTDVRLSGKGRR